MLALQYSRREDVVELDVGREVPKCTRVEVKRQSCGQLLVRVRGYHIALNAEQLVELGEQRDVGGAQGEHRVCHLQINGAGQVRSTSVERGWVNGRRLHGSGLRLFQGRARGRLWRGNRWVTHHLQ